MANETTRKIGAQRFYNAIKQGNVGMVAMYINTNTDVVQGFNEKKAFEAWKEGGCSAEMLGVLLQNPLLNMFGRGRRYYTFGSFGRAVMSEITQRAKKINAVNIDRAEVDQIVALLAAVNTEKNDEWSDIGNVFSLWVNAALDFPYTILSKNQTLAEVVLADPALAKQDKYLTWYLDTFGTVKDDNTASDALRRMFQNQEWDRFKRLVPDLDVRKKIFAKYPYEYQIRNAVSGHAQFLNLKANIAPWIG